MIDRTPTGTAGAPAEPTAIGELADSRRVRIGLIAMLFVIVVATLAGLSLATLAMFEDALAPALARKAGTVGELMAGRLARTVALGVPIDRMVGLDAFVANRLDGHPEIHRVTLHDHDGRLLYERSFEPDPHAAATGRAPAHDPARDPVRRFPVTVGDREVATLAFALDPDWLAREFNQIFYDVLTIFCVSLLLTFEIIYIVLRLHIETPIRQVVALLARARAGSFRHVAVAPARDEIGRSVAALNRLIRDLHHRRAALAARVAAIGPRLPAAVAHDLATLTARLGAAPERLVLSSPSDLRLPLFVFFFATELSRAFLPLFAAALAPDDGLVPRSVAVALPMIGYGLVAVVLTPVAGTLVDRWGARHLFLVGLVPTVAGLAGQGVAGGLWALVGWRAVEGVGFALVSIAALGYIQTVTTPDTRARGAAVYAAAFVTAGICGTLIGGVLADRIGYGPTIGIGAVLAAVSAAIVWSELPDLGGGRAAAARLGRGDFRRALAAPRFLAVALLVGVPAQMIASGYLYYAIPLLLNDAGLTTATIGRVMMVYFLANLVVTQGAAPLADRVGHHAGFAGGGLVVAGFAALVPIVWFELWPIVASVVVLGVAQAAGAPSRGALMIRECGQITGVAPGAAISLYRLIERLGAVAGPIATAALVDTLGLKAAVAATGGLVAGTGALYLLAARRAADRA